MLAKTNKMLRTELIRQLMFALNSGAEINMYLVFSYDSGRSTEDTSTDLENVSNTGGVNVYAKKVGPTDLFAVYEDNVNPNITIGQKNYFAVDFNNAANLDRTKDWAGIYFNVNVQGSSTYNAVSVVTRLFDSPPGGGLAGNNEYNEFELSTMEFSQAMILMQARPANRTLPATAEEFPVLINL